MSLTYHHSHFLATNKLIVFHNFFHSHFTLGHTFFTAWLFWVNNISFCKLLLLSVAGRRNQEDYYIMRRYQFYFNALKYCNNTKTLSHILINKLELFFSVAGRINQGEYLDSPCGDTSFIALHSNTLIKQTLFLNFYYNIYRMFWNILKFCCKDL